jgi:hypothetical protein
MHARIRLHCRGIFSVGCDRCSTVGTDPLLDSALLCATPPVQSGDVGPDISHMSADQRETVFVPVSGGGTCAQTDDDTPDRRRSTSASVAGISLCSAPLASLSLRL